MADCTGPAATKRLKIRWSQLSLQGAFIIERFCVLDPVCCLGQPPMVLTLAQLTRPTLPTPIFAPLPPPPPAPVEPSLPNTLRVFLDDPLPCETCNIAGWLVAEFNPVGSVPLGPGWYTPPLRPWSEQTPPDPPARLAVTLAGRATLLNPSGRWWRVLTGEIRPSRAGSVRAVVMMQATGACPTCGTQGVRRVAVRLEGGD